MVFLKIDFREKNGGGWQRETSIGCLLQPFGAWGDAATNWATWPGPRPDSCTVSLCLVTESSILAVCQVRILGSFSTFFPLTSHLQFINEHINSTYEMCPEYPPIYILPSTTPAFIHTTLSFAWIAVIAPN